VSGKAVAIGATRETFAAFVAEELARQVRATEGELASVSTEIGELSRKLVALERKLRAGSGRVAELSSISDVERFAGEQYERLLALSHVASVDVRQGQLVVDTDDVTIEWEGRRYRLGEYRIALDLAGDVRIDSLDHLGPKAGWDHPHIQAGLPCLGNLRPGVLKLIAEFELALAAQLLLEFLTIYQPETAYTPIEDWPLA